MAWLEALQSAPQTYTDVYIAIARWVVPLLSALLLLRAIRPLISFRREPEIWAWLCIGEDKIPLTHWENVVGSHKRCDVRLKDASVDSVHAVFTRYDDGTWTVADANSRSGVYLNGKPIEIEALKDSDTVRLGAVEMKLQRITARQEARLAQLRTRPGSIFSSMLHVILLTLLQALCLTGFLLNGEAEHARDYLIGFGGVCAGQWLLFVLYALLRRPAFELESIAFYLCTMGMAAICSVCPGEALKQVIAIGMGICVFLIIGWSLRDVERAKFLRNVAAVAGIAFLLATLIFGKEINGAKNWIMIGGISLQPSELSKVCFVFVGASAMDRIVTRKNLILFIVYSVAVCACLALMNDFGTALIFFCAFLVIAYLRSGSIGTIGLSLTGVGIAGMLAVRIAPHALRRFQNYRHIWQAPLEGGYQQTRALMCMASGGLLGLGAAEGWMHNVFAADSDMVVATVCEEWGLVVLLLMVVSVCAMGIFAVRSAAMGRSSFYTISGCAAAGILLVQSILNVLGTVDVLPLTGVTFPFLSNGGSSMIASWGLLVFLKAMDTRQNASFAIALHKSRGGEQA